MTTKYDYIALKNQYVQTPGLSIRELCRLNGIATWSTVATKAKKDGWDDLRAELNRQVESRELSVLADKRANKVAEIQDDTLSVLHAGILKMGSDMDAREPVMDGANVLRDADGEIVWRPVMRFGVNQLETLIKSYLSITGQPGSVTENRNLNLGITAEADHDELRAILAAVRPRAALAGSGGEDQDPDPPRTRSN